MTRDENWRGRSGNVRPRGVRAWKRTLDAEAALAPAMCCLATGTSRDQSALAEVRSMVVRTKVAGCGQTGEHTLARFYTFGRGADFFHSFAELSNVESADGLMTHEDANVFT